MPTESPGLWTDPHPLLGLVLSFFRTLHCFGGTCTGVEREMVTHFMLAVLSWWETSGVRPVFVGERMGQEAIEWVETAEPPF